MIYPLMVSKFHNQTHGPKGQENKICTIVKDREMFYPVTQSQSPAAVKSNMFLNGYSLEAKNALRIETMVCIFSGPD